MERILRKSFKLSNHPSARFPLGESGLAKPSISKPFLCFQKQFANIPG